MQHHNSDYPLDSRPSLLRRVSKALVFWPSRGTRADARVVVRLERIRQQSL